MVTITKAVAKRILEKHKISGADINAALKKCRKFSAQWEIEYYEKDIHDFIKEHKEKNAEE